VRKQLSRQRKKKEAAGPGPNEEKKIGPPGRMWSMGGEGIARQNKKNDPATGGLPAQRKA